MVLSHGLGDGHLITERFARGRAGSDRHRLAIAEPIDGIGLMGEELIERQRLSDGWEERSVKRTEPGSTGRKSLNMHDPTVVLETLQQLV